MNLTEITTIRMTRQNGFILLVALFVTLTGNTTLLQRLLEIYPLQDNLPFLLGLGLFFTAGTMIFLLLIAAGRHGRWVLGFFLISAAVAGYYMDQYGIVIDVEMIVNIVETHPQELAELMSLSLLIRVLLLGLLPAYLVFRFYPPANNLKGEWLSKLALTSLLAIIAIVSVAPFTAQFASFVREHKITRLYANPLGFTNSAVKFVLHTLNKPSPSGILEATAADARSLETNGLKELIILVVGETARADRFSLNGYPRETNPLLKQQNVLSFRNASSCATSTGESLPCMFSALTREDFSREKASRYENALDVLFEHDVQVLWRDNNSDSKGVAARMLFENFKSPANNPVCDNECRDIGMLSGLDGYIKARQGKDILIVLHQMGNHGPEYYRRYPQAFKKFTPICKTGELQKCTQQEIDNSYDNAILYTDYFLSSVIDFLKDYENTHATAMLYVSDHGESLGENGIYLHAAPYAIAPKAQIHIPVILWTGKRFDYQTSDLIRYQDTPISHDDLFCSLLIAYELKSDTCKTLNPGLLLNRELTLSQYDLLRRQLVN
jgi:lipid A ethanolaminephosphotransferase